MPKIFKQQKFTVIKFLCPWYSSAMISLRALQRSSLFSFPFGQREEKCDLLLCPAFHNCLPSLSIYCCLDHQQWGGLIFPLSHTNPNKGNFRKEEQPQIYLKSDKVNILLLVLLEDNLIFFFFNWSGKYVKVSFKLKVVKGKGSY